MSAVPADAYALSLGPPGNTRAYFIDNPDDFVSRNAWILDAGPHAFFCENVTVTNTTGLLEYFLSFSGLSRGVAACHAGGAKDELQSINCVLFFFR